MKENQPIEQMQESVDVIVNNILKSDNVNIYMGEPDGIYDYKVINNNRDNRDYDYVDIFLHNGTYNEEIEDHYAIVEGSDYVIIARKEIGNVDRYDTTTVILSYDLYGVMHSVVINNININNKDYQKVFEILEKNTRGSLSNYSNLTNEKDKSGFFIYPRLDKNKSKIRTRA